VGVGTASLVSDYAGAHVSWWVFSLAALVLVALLGFRDIELSSRVLAVVLISEVLSVLVLDAGILVTGGRDGLSLEPFNPSGLGEGTPVTGLLFAFLAYIGFEATAVFRNEARDPDRTIPRATYAAVACIATFYALSSWLVVVGVGVDSAVEKSTADPVNFVFTVAGDYVSPALGDVMQVLIVTSFFACTLSFHNVIARYLCTLAGAGVMPAALARVHEKHQSPARASLAATVITTVAFAVLLVLGWDPLVQIYTWLAGASTLGLIALMAVTSLAVLVYFRRTDSDRRVWHTLVAPLLALIGLLVATWLVIDNFALLTGGDTAAVVLGATVAGVFVAGMVTALLIRVFSPQSYERLRIADADEPVPTPVLEDDK
jgi:amino acid transporter